MHCEFLDSDIGIRVTRNSSSTKKTNSRRVRLIGRDIGVVDCC
jgi:hypothetical protein